MSSLFLFIVSLLDFEDLILFLSFFLFCSERESLASLNAFGAKKFDRNEGNFTDDLGPEDKAMMYKELEKYKKEDPNFDPDVFLKDTFYDIKKKCIEVIKPNEL